MSRRYSPYVLRSLGYNNFFVRPEQPQEKPEISPADDLRVLAAGGFDDIMQVVFSTEDGQIPNALSVVVGENTPESVKRFVAAILNCNIPALKSAPDSETALEMLCPRSMQSFAGMEAYRNAVAETLNRYSAEFAANQQNSETPKTE